MIRAFLSFGAIGACWCALAGAQDAALSLNGSWEFRFEEGRSAEEAFAADFAATDTMTVPGCFDMMPKWLLKKGTGLYRRVIELARCDRRRGR